MWIDPAAVESSLAASPDSGEHSAELTPPQLATILDANNTDSNAELSAAQVAAILAAEQQASTWGTTPLMLPPEKAELLQFMVADLKESAEKITPILVDAASITARSDAADAITALSESMAKTSDFFEFRSLHQLVRMLGKVGRGLADVSDVWWDELTVRVRAIQSLIIQHATALEVAMETTWPLAKFESRIDRLLAGRGVHADIIGWHKGDADKVLELDAVVEGIEPAPQVDDEEIQTGNASTASALQSASQEQSRDAKPAKADEAHAVDFIRVEASVIDGIMSTIGDLVQQKNRLRAIAAEIRSGGASLERIESVLSATDRIDRTANDLQTAVLATRMQPLAKLFDRYPRIVRDVARIADKQIELELHGGETMVDRAIFEGLADPLVAILRNCASHMIELPPLRKERSKPEVGSVKLQATNQGSQVVVTIDDDGDGFDLETTRADAVRFGIIPEAAAERVDSQTVLCSVFDHRYQSSPLSGVGEAIRGKLGGSIRVWSEFCKGSRIQLTLPMRSAIVPAILASAADATYAIPLQSVREIVRTDREHLSTIQGRECFRLRDSVLGVVRLRNVIGASEGGDDVAIIVSEGDQSAAITVDRIIAKQDIVIRPIEEESLRNGPFSGAAIIDDGKIALILDLGRVLSGTADATTESSR